MQTTLKEARQCVDCDGWFMPHSHNSMRCPTCQAWHKNHYTIITRGGTVCPMCGALTTRPDGMHAKCLERRNGRIPWERKR